MSGVAPWMAEFVNEWKKRLGLSREAQEEELPLTSNLEGSRAEQKISSMVGDRVGACRALSTDLSRVRPGPDAAPAKPQARQCGGGRGGMQSY